MPYNTRRKSLSLPSLGIHVPVTHAARAAAAAAAAANRCSPPGPSSPALSSRSPSSSPSSPDVHASKKAKRSHQLLPPPPPPAAASSSRKTDVAVKLEETSTPPPSPKPARRSVEMDTSDLPVVKKVDLEGIHDEIVEAVIVQLQNTGNRPHLVKELSEILMPVGNEGSVICRGFGSWLDQSDSNFHF